MNQINYNGNNLFKLNFGLYGYEDIDFKASKESILSEFKANYWDLLTEAFKSFGITLNHLSYYSPSAYNFENDSIDPAITVTNKDKLKSAIVLCQKQINEALAKNKSYDGYMALTVDSVNTELENLKKDNYQPDIIVLSVLLLQIVSFSGWFIEDHLVYDPQEC